MEVDGRQVAFAYLDVLGFRQSLKANPGELVNTYRQVIQRIRLTVGTRIPVRQFKVGQSPEQGRDRLLGFTNVAFVAIFSDSIFVFGMDDSAQTCSQVASLSNVIFRNLLDAGLPTKGAAVVGQAWCLPNERVFAGDAIVRAHELSSGLDFIGIVLSPTFPPIAAASLPLRVPVKSGGFAELRVPFQNTGLGMAVASEYHLQERWMQLEQQAEASDLPSLIAKYHSSHVIRDALLTNHPGNPSVDDPVIEDERA